MRRENFYVEVIVKYLSGEPYMSTQNWLRFIVPIIILAIITGFLAGYTYLLSQQVNNLQSENSALKTENTRLKDERDQLSSWLQGNKTYYESQVTLLSTQVSQLQTWLNGNISLLNSVITERNQLTTWLQGNKTYYESQIASLNSQIQQLQSWLNGNISLLNAVIVERDQLFNWLQGNKTYYQSQISSLQSQLAMINSSFQEYVNAYNYLRDRVNMRWDQSNVKPFITPSDPLVSSTVYSITGWWSNTSDWNEFWRDVKALYDWVVENIEYRYDGLYPMLPDTPFGSLEFWNDMWQFPNETLKLGRGDCEDMAILLASMIMNYNGMRYDVEVILISGAKGAHAAVQLPVIGGQIVILDPAGHYYTHDAWGNIASKDIDAEINNWLNYWKPKLGSDVRVVRVFSDYIDIKFNNMSEYLTWMYSRTRS
jgi:hypothetical protein